MCSVCILIVGDADQSFTANEMPYLSRVFERVLVFALNARRGRPLIVKYPANVTIFQVDVTSGLMRIPRYVLRGLFCREKALSLWSLNPKRLLPCLYARGRSDSVLKFILAHLDASVRSGKGAVYSYWFTDQAITAWRLAAELNCRGGHFRSVSRAHGYDLYWERNSAGFLPYQDVSLEKLDGTYPCSEHGVRYLQGKYPRLANRPHVARLGTNDFGRGITPDTTRTFVTCCRIIQLKRMPLFAEAFCRFGRKHPDARWFCIGDGEDLARTKQVVEQCGASGAVTFLGNVNNADLMTFYQKTPLSYLVNVSTTEGVPVSVMEALSFGIPVIATDVGGSGELVSHDCGCLVEADLDAEKLAAILERETSLDREAYLQKRQCARMTWERLASAECNYTDWCKVLTA